VATPDVRARFDSPRERHHHLRRIRCGVLLDVFDGRLDVEVPAEIAASTGFEITDSEVQLAGICPACQRQLDWCCGPGLRRRHVAA
jgi:Fe2+ or Zn2+ uptake regulation protein